jgi:hypothetical protein
MRGYETRQYEGTPTGQLVQRTIGKGIVNHYALILEQTDEYLLTENNEYIRTEQRILPALTYRIRRSNGIGGAPVGELIQDRYPYFIPSTIMHPNGNAARTDFAAAVAAWQALSGAEKKYWNAEVWKEHRNMSGYNLFIKKYRLGEL